MALYQITISYDGTDFHGFQRQINKRTVQGELELALNKLDWLGKSIISSGRTDTGVHAEGQISAFELNWNHSDEELKMALNFHLPSDISIKNAAKAENGFHPRYDAKLRKYRYQFYISATSDALLERYHWRVWPEPSFEIMEDAAKMMCGEHDFSLYGKPPKKGGRTVRSVESIDWKNKKGNVASFQITANSFLYHMVRRITYILIRVGQSKFEKEAILESFDGMDNLPSGIAPANGLFLEEIIY